MSAKRVAPKPHEETSPSEKQHELETRGAHTKHKPRPKPRGKSVVLTIHAPVEHTLPAQQTAHTQVAIFDENDALLGVAPVTRGIAKVTAPATQVGRMVRVFHLPADDAVKVPTIARLRRNLAIEERFRVRPELDLRLPPALDKYWRRSCCRVRGRVFMRVTLPNGTVQERPLCNARIVICEVDTSIRGIVRKLPNDLVYRLRDEWFEAIRRPPIGPDLSPELEAIRGGLHLALRTEATVNLQARAGLLELERTATAAHIREALIARVDLLRPYWCVFDWLERFYQVDCIQTVAVDDDGSFDTEISYPCYGDHPDLYFKVEQDCHPGGWLTVYAPSVQCNTRWDYCCGTPVNIQVTHPAAVPGRAPTPHTWPYSPGNPASVGSWELLPYTSGVFVVHSALMHTGKVLLFSGTAEINLPRESRVWDPDTGSLTAQPFAIPAPGIPPDDLFCSGHAFLTDGRVLVNGGAVPGQGRGIRATHIFDPATETWSKVRDMNHARWYPTTLTLPDGKAITFSGRDGSAAVVPQVEVYDPATDTWTDLPASANKTLEIYPSLHIMSDGKILYTGTRWAGSLPWMSPPASALFDPATNTWTDVDDHVIPNRTEGCSVLLPPRRPALEIHEHDDIPKAPKTPPTLSRVLVVGGPGSTAAEQACAEIIDMADAAPAWRRITDMNFRRTNVNGVILPDGKVLFCTGIDGFKWGPNVPTLSAEIFDPQTETWTTMAAMSVARQYHSSSILLPDARVLNTGSVGPAGNILSMEVYSPPYLFRGPRPSISACPSTVGYGAEFTVESPDSCRIDQVTLIRASTITHHTNTDQRFLALAWHRDGRCGLRVTAPANANLAPPGYYLLFLIDDSDVPSIARFVQLGSGGLARRAKAKRNR